MRRTEGAQPSGRAHGFEDRLQWLLYQPPSLSERDHEGGIFPARTVFIMSSFLSLPRYSGRPPSTTPAFKGSLLFVAVRHSPHEFPRTVDAPGLRLQTKAILKPGREVAPPPRTFPRRKSCLRFTVRVAQVSPASSRDAFRLLSAH